MYGLVVVRNAPISAGRISIVEYNLVGKRIGHSLHRLVEIRAFEHLQPSSRGVPCDSERMDTADTGLTAQGNETRSVLQSCLTAESYDTAHSLLLDEFVNVIDHLVYLRKPDKGSHVHCAVFRINNDDAFAGGLVIALNLRKVVRCDVCAL